MSLHRLKEAETPHLNFVGQVVTVVTEQLLDIIDDFRGGIMGEDHSWI